MKTNGSHNAHIQVDSQTIETALDDEALPPTVVHNEAKRPAVTPPMGNVASKRRKVSSQQQNGETTNTISSSSEDLLDILDNFLITTASSTEAPTAFSTSNLSAPSRSESITNVSNLGNDDDSIKFTFEEDEEGDVEGKQWMFCHVPGCSFWTSKSSRMERHKLCHSEPSELEVKRCYKCPDCHLKFYSLAKLLKHDRRKHTGIKDYECRICGAEVTDIQTHMRVRILLLYI